MHTLRFYPTLRIVPMNPALILGIPFLHMFKPLFNWQARSFRIHRQDGIRCIPIVHRRPNFDATSVAFPHDPAPAASAGGIQFPELEEPTEEDKRAVAKLWDAAHEDTMFGKTPLCTTGDKAKHGRKMK